MHVQMGSFRNNRGRIGPSALTDVRQSERGKEFPGLCRLYRPFRSWGSQGARAVLHRPAPVDREVSGFSCHRCVGLGERIRSHSVWRSSVGETSARNRESSERALPLVMHRRSCARNPAKTAAAPRRTRRLDRSVHGNRSQGIAPPGVAKRVRESDSVSFPNGIDSNRCPTPRRQLASRVVHLRENAEKTSGDAVAAGAKLLIPLTDRFWDNRIAWVMDPSGHVWTIPTRIEETIEDERQARFARIRAATAEPREGT
jgi:hypothetical protein